MSRQRFEMKPQSTGSESDYVVDFPGSDEDYGLCGGAEIFLCLSLVLVKKRFLRDKHCFNNVLWTSSIQKFLMI